MWVHVPHSSCGVCHNCSTQLVALSCRSLGYLARSIGFSFRAYLYLYRHLTDAAFSACKWHSLRHFGSTNEGDFKTLPVWHENELPAKAAEGLPLTVSKVLSQKTETVSKRYLWCGSGDRRMVSQYFNYFICTNSYSVYLTSKLRENGGLERIGNMHMHWIYEKMMLKSQDKSRLDPKTSEHLFTVWLTLVLKKSVTLGKYLFKLNKIKSNSRGKLGIPWKLLE